ncbi:MAG: hypothetical protein RL106_306 [Bacteroidota bacterium]|jgi:uncharacterized membrane-anchored protein YitT (DUF2179 family)
MKKNRVQWNTPHQLRQILMLALAVIMASIGLKGFLLPNHFLDGGVTGISLIVNAITGWDLSLLIILLNVPFVYMGYKQINRYFAIKSGLAILSLALLVHFIEIPVVTDDKLLIAVFGGVFLGGGIGFAMRGGGVIDGTEVLAVSVSRKSTLSVGDFISVLNVLIFLLAAWVFDLEKAMYSMLTYFAASKTVDFIVNGWEEYIGMTIISHHSVKIEGVIRKHLKGGLTIYKGEFGFRDISPSHDNKRIIFCAITRLEVTNLVNIVESLDPEAFIIQHPIKDTRGGVIKKRPLH